MMLSNDWTRKFFGPDAGEILVFVAIVGIVLLHVALGAMPACGDWTALRSLIYA